MGDRGDTPEYEAVMQPLVLGMFSRPSELKPPSPWVKQLYKDAVATKEAPEYRPEPPKNQIAEEAFWAINAFCDPEFWSGTRALRTYINAPPKEWSEEYFSGLLKPELFSVNDSERSAWKTIKRAEYAPLVERFFPPAYRMVHQAGQGLIDIDSPLEKLVLAAIYFEEIPPKMLPAIVNGLRPTEIYEAWVPDFPAKKLMDAIKVFMKENIESAIRALQHQISDPANSEKVEVVLDEPLRRFIQGWFMMDVENIWKAVYAENQEALWVRVSKGRTSVREWDAIGQVLKREGFLQKDPRLAIEDIWRHWQWFLDLVYKNENGSVVRETDDPEHPPDPRQSVKDLRKAMKKKELNLPSYENTRRWLKEGLLWAKKKQDG